MFVYNYTISITNVDSLYSYLHATIDEIKSVTADYNTNDVNVYVDNQLTTEQETTLNTLIDDYTNPVYDPVINVFRCVSTINSTTIPLYPNAIFNGNWEDVSNYSTITSVITCDNDSAAEGFEVHFSIDGTSETGDMVHKTTVKTSFEGVVDSHNVVMRFFKLVFKNGSSFNNIKIQSIFHHYKNNTINTNLDHEINDSMNCQVTRAILNGRLENGKYIPINCTGDGHIEVAVHDPVTAFGEVSVAFNTPTLQHDFVYNKIDTSSFTIFEQNNAQVTASNGMLKCISGSNTSSMASVSSYRLLKYRAGQGALGRFTALFDTPQTGNYQIVGFGTTECGLFFGYYNTTFGIFYVPRNVRQLHKIEIATKSSHSQNVEIVLGGITYSIPVTNGASASSTAWEIASADYSGTAPGWRMFATGSTIYVACIPAGAIPGTFSITFPESGEATITKIYDGNNATTTFIPQTSWNVDTCDGSNSSSNPSGVLLNKQNGNLFYVKFQFLGFGYIEFGIENPLSTEFTAVHRVLYANNNIIPNLDNPSLPFTISSKNTTCTSPVTVITSSVAGYTQGIIEDLGLISSFSHNKEISSSLTSIFTLRSQFVFNNKFNLMCVKLKEIIISNYGNQFVELFLYDNTDLENADFQNSDNDDCVVQYDTSATVSNGNKIYTIGVCAGQTVTKNLNDLRIFANHIKHITVCAKTLTSTTNVHVCLVHEQD